MVAASKNLCLLHHLHPAAFYKFKRYFADCYRSTDLVAIFLCVEGAPSESIVVDDGDLRKAAQTVSFENGASKESA